MDRSIETQPGKVHVLKTEKFEAAKTRNYELHYEDEISKREYQLAKPLKIWNRVCCR